MKSLQLVIIDQRGDDEYLKFLRQSKLARDIIRQYFGNQSRSANIKIVVDDEPLETINRNAKYLTIISNGDHYTSTCCDLLNRCVQSSDADIVTVAIEDGFRAYGETPRLTSDGRIAGFRRLFDNVAIKSLCTDRIHHIFVKCDIEPELLKTADFNEIYTNLKNSGKTIEHFCIGGQIWQLKNCKQFHRFYKLNQQSISGDLIAKYKLKPKKGINVVGNVLAEKKVQFGKNVTIIGPAMICQSSKIDNNTIINKAILAPNVKIQPERFIKNRMVTSDKAEAEENDYVLERTHQSSCKGYRKWHRFGYALLGKRIFDILFSLFMIIVFGPIWLIIIAAIKINSPGPIFYKAVRQGKHGSKFKCLKFRSMIVGAEGLQNTLRIKNEVDGPQFKIADDPRISSVGSFLRDTSLDEIPQFFNVLAGQMSMVGPRPSPEAENMKCPHWRDARLSVKPGITGLWQIKRTREPSRDFQEWVYYDTKYVRELSFKNDLCICYKTAMKLIRDFVDRF